MGTIKERNGVNLTEAEDVKKRWQEYTESERKVKLLSRVRLFATPWTIAYKAPLSMGFSRQGYWSGLPFPSPEDLPDPGIEPGSPTLQADVLPSEPPGKPLEYTEELYKKGLQFSSVQFSCSVVSNSLQLHEPQHTRPPCPSPTPRVYPNSCPLSVMLFNHLILCRPLLLLPDLDNHDGVIIHLESDNMECEVKWDLGCVTMNKASGGDEIPAELF